MAAARDRSPEGRARLFSLLGRLFLARGAELSDSDRRGFTDLLALLRPMADLDTRLELAYATAQVDSAPSELARLLAEDELEVAALVLFGAEALGTAELMALAEDEERARIIAGRRRLPMMVADTLMRRGDLEITRALLKNAGSRLSIPALDTAIELARRDADLQHRIAQRPELLEEMAKDMLDWVEAPVREQLVERFELGPPSGLQPGGLQSADVETRLRNLLGLDIEDGPPAEHDPEGDAPVATPSTGPAPDPRFRLTPRVMSDILRRGELVHAEAMFAQMAGIPVPLVRRFAGTTTARAWPSPPAASACRARNSPPSICSGARPAPPTAWSRPASSAPLSTLRHRRRGRVDSRMAEWRQTEGPDSLSA